MLTRRLAQLCSAILYNCNLISDIPAKYINSEFCVPGLNCRYCPASVAGCPLNFMQRLFAEGLENLPIRILCWLLLLALAFGRLICGWLCPFGLVQDLLDKIPTPKIQKSEWTRRLSYLKYILFAVFVVAVPFGFYLGGKRVLAFCQYVCPNMPFSNFFMTLATGGTIRPYMIYNYRFLILAAVILLSVFMFRPFCRFICPLGAFYGLFNKVALLSVKVDDEKCVHCNACLRTCKMDIKKVGDHECISCGECKQACKFGAIHFGMEGNKDKGK
ncbi:MAG: 4Fe-4S binding protein [Acidaminococcaceae bacterium]|nr:4Fe-4S binding protein [Acidaminococcaceae bacterium]